MAHAGTPGINNSNIGIANFWAGYIFDRRFINFAEVMRIGPPFLSSLCIYNSIFEMVFGSSFGCSKVGFKVYVCLGLQPVTPSRWFTRFVFFAYFLQTLKPAILSNELLWNKPLCTKSHKVFTCVHLMLEMFMSVMNLMEKIWKNHKQLIMSSSRRG